MRSRVKDDRFHGSIEGAASAILVFLGQFSVPELSVGEDQAFKTLSLIGAWREL
jgi:hypothetical protein